MRTNRALALLAGVVLAGTLAAPATALAAGGKTMYRFYNQWTGEHLYGRRHRGGTAPQAGLEGRGQGLDGP